MLPVGVVREALLLYFAHERRAQLFTQLPGWRVGEVALIGLLLVGVLAAE